MTKTKIAVACAVIMLAVVLLAGCGASAKYKDGVYYVEAPEFAASGWKETVEITIEDGAIVKINWDAIYKDDSIPIRKKQYSKSGLYGMLAAGAVDEWYDQAIAAEQFVLANGIDALSVDEDGYTDAVSGCTVHVVEFDKLLRECLAQAQK